MTPTNLKPLLATPARARAFTSAVLLALTSTAYAAGPIDPSENVILQWNDATLEAIRITHPGPPIVARMLAIVNTCAFDAWAAYDEKARGTRFGKRLKMPAAGRTEVNKQTSVAFAAYRAAVDLFPQAPQRAFFDALFQQQGFDRTNTSTDISTAPGIGNVACQAVLDFRHHDHANQLGEENNGAPYSDWTGYQPVNTPDQINDPNRWQPLRISDGHGGTVVQKFIAPHWGRVVPFAINDGERQVVAPVRKEIRRRNGRVGPITVDSPLYKAQADEVIAYSATLVDSQKVIAEYWADGPTSELPPGHWDLFAQTVSARDHHTLDQDVKMLFATTNTVFDASIVIWGAKVQFDSVRPITAIHFLYTGKTINAWAGPGQGTQPISGENWQPYQANTVVTPPFAEYPSGHSAFSSSAAEILKRFTGSDVFGSGITQPAHSSRVEPGLAPANDLSLSWATFTDASDEAGISRRYGGIHFIDGDLDSRLMGRQIAALDWRAIQVYFGDRPRGDDGDERGHGR